MEQKKGVAPVRYAVGMLGTSIPINMFKTYAAAYYVNNHGLTTEKFALVLFLYTFLDAIDNPVYGFLSDRTRTKWGRRRPWLMVGTPLLVLCFIAFFNPPAFLQGNGLFMYVLLTYLLTGTLDSLINANYGALFPELFRTDALRAKTNAIRQGFQLVAMVISIALTPIITKQLGYGTTALLYGMLAAVVILYCTLGCREIGFEEAPKKPKLWETLRDILSNSKFWIFGFANAFYSAAMGLVMSAVPFFVQYTLNLDETANTFLLGVVLLLAMVGVSIWAWLVKRVGLINAWRAALIVLCVAFIPLYFVSSLVGALIACTAVGFGFAGAITTMDLIGARIMDEDVQKYGLRREASYTSTMGVLNRCSGFFTSLAFLLVGRLYGFESGTVPGSQPGDAARFLLVIFPFCAMVFSIIFSRFLRFSEN